MARWSAEGLLEYLGRADAQLKIRGFRIEPGEIETALEAFPEVRRAVVVARHEGEGDRRLVAYVEAPAGVEPAVLRHHLGQLLPSYMVPSAFVRLDALPLSAHGKVDRRALPRPDRQAAVSAEAVEPRTPEEAVLARLWREVLRLPEVGVHDNFFELGGDSILSLQIVSRASRHGLELAADALFQHQTVASLAAAARRRPASAAEQGRVAGVAFPTPIQRWFFELEVPRPGHFNQAVMLEVLPGCEPSLLEQALEALQEHHDALRLTAHRNSGEWMLEIPEDGPRLRLARIDLAGLAPIEQKAAIEAHSAEAQAGIELEKGPPAAAVLFHLGTGRPARLLLAIHHLAVDGVSWRILLEDLDAVYERLAAGEPAARALPAKTTSVLEWGRRLAEHATRPERLAELPYWTAAVSHAADLSGGLPGAGTGAEEETVTVRLDRETTDELVLQVPRVYNTKVDDVLLAALVLALCDGKGRRGLRLDLEMHGRAPIAPDLDLRRTVGWFTALYPVWLELPERTAPGEVLKSVKEQLRAVPGQGLGYGLLRYLHPDPEVRRRLAEAPASPLLFNYHGSLDAALPASGLFAAASEDPGPEKDPAARRSHAIEVNAGISGGCLEIHWSFSRETGSAAAVARWAEEHRAAVLRLICHCLEPDASNIGSIGGSTPSDFPEAGLTQSELADLEAELLA